jgi:coniferyl-aldehyde dehydrogenase
VNAATRKDRLQRAAKLITDNHDQLVKAMSADFGNRSHYQSLAADILTTTNMLRHSAEQLEGWMQAEPVASPYPGMQSWIQYQALGVVGIISPWNFPVNLAFGPLAGVFAAGATH